MLLAACAVVAAAAASPAVLAHSPKQKLRAAGGQRTEMPHRGGGRHGAGPTEARPLARAQRHGHNRGGRPGRGRHVATGKGHAGGRRHGNPDHANGHADHGHHPAGSGHADRGRHHRGRAGSARPHRRGSAAAKGSGAAGGTRRPVAALPATPPPVSGALPGAVVPAGPSTGSNIPTGAPRGQPGRRTGSRLASARGRAAATPGGAALAGALAAAPVAAPTPPRARLPAISSAREAVRRAGSRTPIAGELLAGVPGIVWVALAGLGILSVLLATTTAAATAASHRRGRQLTQFESLAAIDALTGLLTRGALESRLAAEVGRARRHGRPLSVVFFDVRGLKAVNDVHGHGAGDRLLRAVGTLLTEISREHDVCGRIGGDECVVVLPEDDAAGAETFRDRVYARLPEVRAEVGVRTPWDLTAGVATFPQDGLAPRELIDAADRRLYQHRGIEIDAPN